MSRHPHDAVIRAWLDDKQIEWRFGRGGWCLLKKVSEEPQLPQFMGTAEYRIKPETIRYRVALFKFGECRYTKSLNDPGKPSDFTNDPGFIRWLGDEQEVEVNP